MSQTWRFLKTIYRHGVSISSIRKGIRVGHNKYIFFKQVCRLVFPVLWHAQCIGSYSVQLRVVQKGYPVYKLHNVP